MIPVEYVFVNVFVLVVGFISYGVSWALSH